jgi:hypothetical protein
VIDRWLAPVALFLWIAFLGPAIYAALLFELQGVTLSPLTLLGSAVAIALSAATIVVAKVQVARWVEANPSWSALIVGGASALVGVAPMFVTLRLSAVQALLTGAVLMVICFNTWRLVVKLIIVGRTRD